jgi:hypothetical protein
LTLRQGKCQQSIPTTTKAPTMAPVKSPTMAPILPSTLAPALPPTLPPTKPPTTAPTLPPTLPFTLQPTLPPTIAASGSPVKVPTSDAPVPAPRTKAPVVEPTSSAPRGVPVTVKPPPFHLRINAGASAPYTDSAGQVWEADRYFSGNGRAVAECGADVPDTVDDVLWCQYRTSQCGFRGCFFESNAFAYSIPLTHMGQYNLTLYFSKRRQQTEVTVQVQEQRHVLPPNFIPKDSTPFTPSLPTMLSNVIPVYVDGSNFFIQFINKDSIEPAVAAIELERLDDTTLAPSLAPTSLASTVSPDALPMRINAGYWEERYVDAAGNHWGGDRFFTDGSRQQLSCPATTDPLFCSDHTGTWFECNLPVPAPGRYNVTLFMAETRTLTAEATPYRFTITGETKIIVTNYTVPVLDRYVPKILTTTDVVNDEFFTIIFQAATGTWATVAGILMDYA